MFQFKQFTIHQDRTAMKVGTDGVLLGAWAPIKSDATNILDIGTGTGLIALMIAQRLTSTDSFLQPNINKLNITAIDIDRASIEQAVENINNSIFARYITTEHTSLQQHNPGEKYDAIVCNPPYFVASLKCPDLARSQARHTDTLSFDDLLLYSSRLLNYDGTLSVILPITEGKTLIDLAPKYNFTLSQIVEVYPTQTTPPKRLLMHFTYNNNDNNIELKKSCLTIEISRHNYTEEYIALTRDFYLKM